jgi:hypothetical protein
MYKDLDRHMKNIPFLHISGPAKERNARGECAQRNILVPFLSLLRSGPFGILGRHFLSLLWAITFDTLGRHCNIGARVGRQQGKRDHYTFLYNNKRCKMHSQAEDRTGVLCNRLYPCFRTSKSTQGSKEKGSLHVPIQQQEMQNAFAG